MAELPLSPPLPFIPLQLFLRCAASLVYHGEPEWSKPLTDFVLPQASSAWLEGSCYNDENDPVQKRLCFVPSRVQ